MTKDNDASEQEAIARVCLMFIAKGEDPETTICVALETAYLEGLRHALYGDRDEAIARVRKFEDAMARAEGEERVN